MKGAESDGGYCLGDRLVRRGLTGRSTPCAEPTTEMLNEIVASIAASSRLELLKKETGEGEFFLFRGGDERSRRFEFCRCFSACSLSAL
jgi:hypothetical protein